MSGVQPIITRRPERFTLNSAATTNITTVFTGPGRLLSINGSNVNAAARFLKLYDLPAAPVLATNRPMLTHQLPAAGAAPPQPVGLHGIPIVDGLHIAITGASGDTDTTVVAANEQKIVLTFIRE